MAEVKILLNKDERKEKEEFLKIVKELRVNEKAKLKGFLQGLLFANDKE